MIYVVKGCEESDNQSPHSVHRLKPQINFALASLDVAKNTKMSWKLGIFWLFAACLRLNSAYFLPMLYEHDFLTKNIVLPPQCSYSKLYASEIECDGDIPDFSVNAPALMDTINNLAIEHCNFVVITRESFKLFRKLKTLKVDCAETVIQHGALDNLTNVSELAIGKHVGSFSPNFFCDFHALDDLQLDNNMIRSDVDFGLKVNCSTNNQLNTCGKQITWFSATKNMITSIKKDGFLCNLHSLVHLNLSGNAITRVDKEAFASVPMLRRLYLAGNAIQELPFGIFDFASNLSRLDLSHNQLSSLPMNVFASLVDLTFLNLAGNQLRTLNAGVFDSLRELTSLDLSNNQIERLDKLFRNLTELIDLNLSGNRMETLDADAFTGLSFLKSLSLDNNRLDFIAKETFSKCPYVTILSISHNKLKKVPNLAPMTTILLLSLEHNDIDEISAADFNATKRILSLNLSHNKLTALGPKLFTSFLFLRRLDFSDNLIDSIDNLAFFDLGLLSLLNLAGNQISFKQNAIKLRSRILGSSHMIVFSPLESLIILNVSHNQMTEFSYSWFPSSLVHLVLSNNKIQKLPTYFFGTTPSLQSLFLANNEIQSLSRHLFPPKLTHLMLNENQINNVDPQTFEDLHNLEILNLRNNSLTTLPKLDLPNASTSILLMDNPLVCDCNIEWLKNWKMGLSSVYDVLLMKCQVLFHHTSKVGDSMSFMATKDEHFLCAFRKNESKSLESKCSSWICRQQQMCPDNCVCYHDHKWSRVKVICSNSTKVIGIPQKLPIATDVSIFDNISISDMDAHTFHYYSNITHLVIRRTQLKSIGETVFSFLINLEKIDLDRNELTILDRPIFNGLSNLSHVDLSFNKLSSVSADVFNNLVSLRTLNLENNRLIKFPFWLIDSFTYISSINVADNPWSCNCSFIVPFNDFVKSHVHKIANVSQLYCQRDPSSDSVTPMTALNISQCFHTHFISDFSKLEQPQVVVMGSHVAAIVVGIMFTVIVLVLGIFIVIFRLELRVAVARRFARLLVKR